MDVAQIRKITGGNIKRLREGAGLTQAQLADKIGIQSQNIWTLEAGRIGLSDARLVQLCEVFQVSPAEFYRVEDEQVRGQIEEMLIALVRRLDEVSRAKLLALGMEMEKTNR